jgi:hypothetical protein
VYRYDLRGSYDELFTNVLIVHAAEYDAPWLLNPVREVRGALPRIAGRADWTGPCAASL